MKPIRPPAHVNINIQNQNAKHERTMWKINLSARALGTSDTAVGSWTVLTSWCWDWYVGPDRWKVTTPGCCCGGWASAAAGYKPFVSSGAYGGGLVLVIVANRQSNCDDCQFFAESYIFHTSQKSKWQKIKHRRRFIWSTGCSCKGRNELSGCGAVAHRGGFKEWPLVQWPTRPLPWSSEAPDKNQ